MKKDRLATAALIILLVLIVISFIKSSYAFFKAKSGGQDNMDVMVVTNTVDTLTLSVNNNIKLDVNQENFGRSGSNQSGTATATAVLTPNNTTGTATANYTLYLNISENGINYSRANTDEIPELLLQVFDNDNNLVELTSLGDEITVGDLVGYDITGKSGLFELVENHDIVANNNQVKTEVWRVVVTAILLNVNQNDNAGKSLVGSVYISRNDES